jgi:molybdate transport system ATP-binding protein
MNDIELRFDLALSGFHLDVDLTLPGQGVSAIFGHSGSGKTTLLRCVAGLETPDSGKLSVNGESWFDSAAGINLATHRRPLGYVFQEASLFPHLSVRDNMLFGWKRIAPEQRQIEFDQVAELLGIAPLLERAPSRLSGGERQRVAIARALLTSPSLLLMDEPLSALDGRSKGEILPFLERLHDQLSIPVLYISHSPEEVMRLSDHLVLLDKGQATASGPMIELATRLDLSLAHGDSAAAIIDAEVESHDDHYHLSYLRFAGGRLTVSRQEYPLGHRMRVLLHARDVSLAVEPPQRSSILNKFVGKVVDYVAEPPARALVRIDCNGAILLARITWKSAEELLLKAGKEVHVQVKSVALMGG